MSEDKDIKKEKKETEKEKEVLEEKALVEVEENDDFDSEAEKKSTGPQIEELPDDIKKKLEKRKTERNEKKNKKKKKKVARKVVIGNAYVKATYNNTIITLTDQQGNVLSWGSAGVAGFKGAKKSTPYAASIITRIAVEKAREEYGLEEVSVFVSGVGTGRESAVRALNANGLFVNLIKDITPVPHNGCRPKKPRRV